jgi:hypothetical protein
MGISHPGFALLSPSMAAVTAHLEIFFKNTRSKKVAVQLLSLAEV